jgi:GTPase SAR1 family protein
MVERLNALSRDTDRADLLFELLRRASAQVADLGPEFVGDHNQLNMLGTRLRENRCHLAVLGQFKRGKSTLVNALLGEPLLPAAVVPLTSIPTFLYGGEQLAARVLFENGQSEQQFTGESAAKLTEFLARYVTESANPRNRLGVRQVEASYPAFILRQGVVLIDTPGIGSTFQHNTETTVNFLPQCDAALFVVSADPPITQVEVEFLKAARRTVVRMIFILNKVDYLDTDEQEAAVAFLQQVLCGHVGFSEPPQIHCVSARQGLAACRNKDPTGWQRSGMADIERQIVEFLLREKTDVLNRALASKASDLLSDVQGRLKLMSRSLQMPLTELDQRMAQFEQSLVTIEEQRIVAMKRLDLSEKYLADSVVVRSSEVLANSMAMLEGVVSQCQYREGPKWSEETTREAIAEAIPRFFEHEFGIVYELCQKELREAILPYRLHADELIASVHQLVERLFDVPFDRHQREITLVKAEHPFWRTHKWTIRFAAIPENWIDRLLPRRFRHARIRRRIMGQVEYLATRNVGFLQWSTLQNLKQSIDNFRESFNQDLQKILEATRRAIDVVRRRRTLATEGAAPEIERLETSAGDLQALKDCLCSYYESSIPGRGLAVETSGNAD